MNLALATPFITPDFIIDVGANIGHWSKEARKLWPDASILLIEGNPECEPYLLELGFPFIIAVLSNCIRSIEFFSLRDCACATGASYYLEQTEFFKNGQVKSHIVSSSVLDDLTNTTNRGDVLLKLDTQGSELDILRGAPRTLSQVKAIVIEVSYTEYNKGAPNASMVNRFLEEAGFVQACVITQIVHPISRDHIQDDLLYVRKP